MPLRRAADSASSRSCQTRGSPAAKSFSGTFNDSACRANVASAVATSPRSSAARPIATSRSASCLRLAGAGELRGTRSACTGDVGQTLHRCAGRLGRHGDSSAGSMPMSCSWFRSFATSPATAEPSATSRTAGGKIGPPCGSPCCAIADRTWASNCWPERESAPTVAGDAGVAETGGSRRSDRRALYSGLITSQRRQQPRAGQYRRHGNRVRVRGDSTRLSFFAVRLLVERGKHRESALFLQEQSPQSFRVWPMHQPSSS